MCPVLLHDSHLFSLFILKIIVEIGIISPILQSRRSRIREMKWFFRKSLRLLTVRVRFQFQVYKNLKSKFYLWANTTSQRKFIPTHKCWPVLLLFAIVRTWQFLLRFFSQKFLALKIRDVVETILTNTFCDLNV